MSGTVGLRATWDLVRLKPVGSGLRAASFDGGGSRIWATVTDEGDEGLLISVRADELIGHAVSAVAQASSALAAEVYNFTDEGHPARGLHLWCKRPDLLGAFVGFCETFIARCLLGENVAKAFSASFDEFRRLVAGAQEDAVSGALVGLLGELIVLSDLVAIDQKAVELWAYPTLERHDFRNGSTAIEVKTTLRSQNGKPIVRISAFDQLEPPIGGSLYLHWLRLERDPAGVHTVARLVEGVAGQLPVDRRAAFIGRVFSEGSLNAHQNHAFSLQERCSYRVRDAFPRLTASRLVKGEADPGIGRVRYDLDLSAAAAYRCRQSEANEELLAGGRIANK